MSNGNLPKLQIATDSYSSLILSEPDTSSLFTPGTVINEEYLIEKHIASGSIADVYLCSHLEQNNSRYALKVLRALSSDNIKDPAASLRFKREVRICLDIDHPNVVNCFSYFRAGQYHAFVMEYLPGGDLAEYLRKNGRTTVDYAMKILHQACSGVQAFHDKGIVHRDLKPENLLLTENGDVKIGDFGIAHIVNSRRLTEGDSVLGTIQYLSPEYLKDGQCDVRCDIYTLGLVVYEMLSGVTPFDGDNLIDILKMKVGKKLPSLHSLRCDCPRGLSQFLDKALEPRPQRRFQSVGEMMKALRSIMHLH